MPKKVQPIPTATDSRKEFQITCRICACPSVCINANGAKAPASSVNIGIKMAMLG
ncbi:hypothetical protein D3C81_1708590 [compost metagenome]